MEFVWDERKRTANLRKHGFDFVDAREVFRGLTYTVPDDRDDYGEERNITFGFCQGTLVVIAHTEERGSLRVISMRKATRYEQKEFFAQVGDRLEADPEDEG